MTTRPLGSWCLRHQPTDPVGLPHGGIAQRFRSTLLVAEFCVFIIHEAPAAGFCEVSGYLRCTSCA